MPAPYKRVIHGDWVALEEIILELFRILNADTTLLDITSDLVVVASDLDIAKSNIVWMESDIDTNTSDIVVLKSDVATNASDIIAVAGTVPTSDVATNTSDIVVLKSDVAVNASDLAIVAGNDTEIIYNNGGVYGGDSTHTFNDSTKVVSMTGLVVTNAAVFGSDSAVFQPNADSTTFFHVDDAGGTSVFNVDTTNKEVEIRANSGVNTPTLTFYDTDSNIGLDQVFGRLEYFKTDISGSGNHTVARFDVLSDDIFGADVAFSMSWWKGASWSEGFRFRQNGLLSMTPSAPVDDSSLKISTSAWDKTFPLVEFSNTDNFPENASSVLKLEAYGRYESSYYLWCYSTNRSSTDFIINQLGDIGIGNEAAVPETILEIAVSEPYITLHNVTHEDTDGGRESRLDFKGQQSGGEKTTLTRIEVGHDGAVDDEKGYWDLFINDGDDGDSPTKAVRVDSLGAVFETGPIFLKETTTPTARTNYAAIYATSDNELFWQDGAGTEHLLHGDAFSEIWFHGANTVEVAISTQSVFTIIDSFTVVGHSDDLLNVVGSSVNNTLTLSALGAGEYEVSYHGSMTATGGADKEMIFAFGITLATPKDITDVTDNTITPIVITSAGHGLENGDMVEIVGVVGNTAANGSFIVDNKATNTFEIVDLAGGATTGNGDYNEGSPTGDITILYPGNMVVHRMVRGADLGAMSATGIHILAANDVLALYVANVSGTTNLTVAAVNFDVNRIGD